MGKKKIVLVFQADSLVEQASNKLLKAIEEPAPNTHIILISNKIEYVLPTITSRCQIYSIPNLNSEDEFTNYLNFNNINIESQLVTQSEFNPGVYINIVENLNEIKELEKLFIDWLRDCFKLNMKALVSYGDLFSSYNREQIFASISSFISLFRNTFHFDTTEIPKHTSLDLSKLSPFINSNNIDQIYGYMQELMYSIQRNANTRLAMMDTSIKIGMAIRPK
jgi:DNA polymerase-3 subunit delta'